MILGDVMNIVIDVIYMYFCLIIFEIVVFVIVVVIGIVGVVFFVVFVIYDIVMSVNEECKVRDEL